MRILALLAAAGLLTLAAPADAYNQQVTSNLWAEGYSVYVPGGTRIRKRRLVEDLRLGAWNLLPGSDHPYYRGPRLSIEIALRLDTDFSVGQNESNQGADSAYVPGLTPVRFDTQAAYFDARGLAEDTLDLRGGRQIRVDTTGFFAFDGLETRLHFPFGIGLDTYVGYEIRGGQTLGYDALELDGTDSGGRHGMEEDRTPDRTDPSPRLAVGTELRLAPCDWLDAALSFRAVGITGRPADERLGGRLTLGNDLVRAEGRTIWSPLLDILTELDAQLGVTPIKALTVYLEYQYFQPIFEADSIFNVFDLSPQNNLGARIEARLRGGLTVAGWGFARLAENSAGLAGNREDTWISGAGGGLGADHRTPGREISARLSWVNNWGEHRIGGELGVRHGLLPGHRLWLGYRISAWSIDDAFSNTLRGELIGYVVSARFRIAKGAHLLGEFEHYVGHDEPRFVGLALLQLDFWR